MFTSTISAGTGLPLTPLYLAPEQGTGVIDALRPNYTGASVYAAPPGLSLNPRRLFRAAAGTIWRCGAELHHRAFAVYFERFGGTHVPIERPVERRLTN